MRSPSPRYSIEGPIGRGGMGEVYRAFDTLLKRPVALKVLRPDRTDDAATGIRRMLREARACAAFQHPNVVAIYDVGEGDGTAFIAMELLDGEPLRSSFAGRGVPTATKLDWLVQIASALDAAHAAGIVHRDIKPDNVMLCSDGRVRLIDFGIARAESLDALESHAGSIHGLGTPRYMAPEQKAGAAASPLTDQYAWGIVAYEVLTELSADVRPQDLARNADWPPDLPAHWRAGLGRATSGEPDERFANMGALLGELAGAVPRLDARAFAATEVADSERRAKLWTDDAHGTRHPRAAGREDDEDDVVGSRRGPLPSGMVLDGRYRIDRLLGQGAMGAVYAAEHLVLKTRVAIKVLVARATPESLARFAQEARVTAELRSEHAIRVLDVATPDGRAPYIVMELLEGTDLEGLLKRRTRLPLDEAARYVLEACDAVAEAHALGVVHRDLKPANLFLTTGRQEGAPTIKVLDFGLSKIVRGEALGDVSLSKTYAFMGSPAYMSPEQIRNAKAADHRADIWSLAVVLYELVTGALPFPDDSAAVLLLAIANKPWVPASERRGELPASFDAVLARCLEKEPADRYPDIAAFVDALRPFAARAPSRALHSVQHESAALSAGSSNAPKAFGPPRLEPRGATTTTSALTAFAPSGAGPEVRSHGRALAIAGVLAVALAGAAIARLRDGTATIRPAEASRPTVAATALSPGAATPPTAPSPISLPAVVPVATPTEAATDAGARPRVDTKGSAPRRAAPPVVSSPTPAAARTQTPPSSFQPVTDRLD
ncbi:MAG: protein kinase [Myxococcales bacterium]|nr:protein kinase [Myxococcales bacterium]